MTKFKIYTIHYTGEVYTHIVEAGNWIELFEVYQYYSSPIFKVEVVAGEEHES